MKNLTCLILVMGMLGCGKSVQGPKGDSGASGAAGQDGKNCTVSSLEPSIIMPSGGSLITCPDGTQSLVLNGNNGVNGQDGTVITPVKLCSGITVYPSTFVEVAFCINNVLYGVYSANGGFATELPPGTYSSNGINNSCTLTIGNNCSVIQN